MYDFEYRRPITLTAAEESFSKEFEPRWLGGGHTLIPSLKQRLLAPGTLIDVRFIPELQGIACDQGYVRVGAASRHAEVAASGQVAEFIPALAQLVRGIGDAQVRNMGTLGGSLANADPAADYPAAVLACKAVLHTQYRQIAADDFFKGMFETALQPGEILTRVDFQIPSRAGYIKFPNPASGYVMVGAFVACFEAEVRVAINGAGPCVFRWQEAEQALVSEFSIDRLEGLTLPVANLNADLHASADYRAALAPVLLRRAVEQAMSRG